MNRVRINNKDLLDFLIKEENENFSGWDFSYLENTGRMKEFPFSWNYTNEVSSRIDSCTSLLDMGTGGGEYLSTLQPLPKNTCATEGYEPNISIAKANLEPLGVQVYPIINDEKLPFEDHIFELIMNKHEFFYASEVKRILKNKGVFITQQVGGMNDLEFNILLGAQNNSQIDWNLKEAAERLKSVGLQVIKEKEDFTRTRFYDIGAIVYYLKILPWQIPDFSVRRYYDNLLKIYNIIQKNGYIDVTCHRFFIIAQK